MALLDELTQKYVAADLDQIFTELKIDSNKINRIWRQSLKEVTLAQWLLESGRATSELSNRFFNFAGLKWRNEMSGFAIKEEIKVPSEPTKVAFCKFASTEEFIRGYWKFLTRDPYKGWEEHTNSPDNFVGFLKRKGYASDPGYVTKVISLLPEAQLLLAEAQGITIPSPPLQLQITRVPKEVEVGFRFGIEGTTSASDAGKTLLFTIDDKFSSAGTAVSSDGSWSDVLVFNQTGKRKLEVAVGGQTAAVVIEVKSASDAKDEDDTPTPTTTSAGTVLKLSGSVGRSGTNLRADVQQVKTRLRELGYTWVSDPSKGIDTGTILAIELFQSIINGFSNVHGDGRVDVAGPTHRWLQAANAPRWQLMPKSNPGIGFINFELEDTGDNHDFGTHWLAEVILAAAKDFHETFRKANPGASPFAINNVSLPHGGDTPIHAGHETGLMCDVLLPKTDGDFGGVDFTGRKYDQKATRAMLKSIRKQKLVRAVFFNDPVLIREGLCSFASGHHHHIHFEINPPVRQ